MNASNKSLYYQQSRSMNPIHYFTQQKLLVPEIIKRNIIRDIEQILILSHLNYYFQIIILKANIVITLN